MCVCVFLSTDSRANGVAFSFQSGQKVGQTIREALTHRDPVKLAACRKRRANSKLKRSNMKTSQNHHHHHHHPCEQHEEMNYDSQGVAKQEVLVPLLSDVDTGSPSEDGSSDSTAYEAATDVESHPLESILIAMTVQRQREISSIP